MTSRKLTRKEIVRKITSIVRGLDPEAGDPELIWCRGQILIIWQDGRGRRLVVDVGRDETFVELIGPTGTCESCVRVEPGAIAPRTASGSTSGRWSETGTSGCEERTVHRERPARHRLDRAHGRRGRRRVGRGEADRRDPRVAAPSEGRWPVTTRRKQPAAPRPTIVERPLWVLPKNNMPRLVAMRTSGRPPVVLDDVRYFAREGDLRWRPIAELQAEKGGSPWAYASVLRWQMEDRAVGDLALPATPDLPRGLQRRSVRAPAEAPGVRRDPERPRRPGRQRVPRAPGSETAAD